MNKNTKKVLMLIDEFGQNSFYWRDKRYCFGAVDFLSSIYGNQPYEIRYVSETRFPSGSLKRSLFYTVCDFKSKPDAENYYEMAWDALWKIGNKFPMIKCVD